MGWFSDITGFAEGSYHGTQARLSVRDDRLYSSASDTSHGVGKFSMSTLDGLRRSHASTKQAGRIRLGVVEADAQDLHRATVNAGALFQVASQFNMLEMTSPKVTPEDGVTRYAWDNTQGPACATAAGAATIYRNYFVPVGNQVGQTSDRQLDGLADIGEALSAATGVPIHALWDMQNGYALALPDGLKAINATLSYMTPMQVDALRGKLRIGFQRDAEVTLNPESPGQVVSQVFCSAMPLGYSSVPAALWEPLARLVLEATYEATLLCGKINAEGGGSRKVFLTLVGAGVFANPRSWVLAALKRALALHSQSDLDVVIVSYGTAPNDLLDLVADFNLGLRDS